MKAGRKIKRKFKRTESLKIRISKPHKWLLNKIRDTSDSLIVSQADIVEWAVEEYGHALGLEIPIEPISYPQNKR